MTEIKKNNKKRKRRPTKILDFYYTIVDTRLDSLDLNLITTWYILYNIYVMSTKVHTITNMEN